MTGIDLREGDCLQVMRTLATEGVQVDAVVTDPPYHLTSIVKRFGAVKAAPAQHGTDGAFARASRGFMGKQWDGGDVAFDPETWRLAYDLMTPGAYLVAFASTRGYHRMVCAIEDARFVIHPMLGWLFGTGFPKATRLKAPDTGHLRYGLQALKPALEPICLAQKPMQGSGTANWLAHGTGALNIDACRIGTETRTNSSAPRGVRTGFIGGFVTGMETQIHDYGRWPANVLHDGSDEVVDAFPRSLVGHVDSGSAARFFYSAKATSDDRCDSKHPTVKPVALMRWLCRLITPPNGLILDPFAGSGTTGVVAIREGFRAILIEREAEYASDIRRRLDRLGGGDASVRDDAGEVVQAGLFDGAA